MGVVHSCVLHSLPFLLINSVVDYLRYEILLKSWQWVNLQPQFVALLASDASSSWIHFFKRWDRIY